jgi:hypothetical protein
VDRRKREGASTLPTWEEESVELAAGKEGKSLAKSWQSNQSKVTEVTG